MKKILILMLGLLMIQMSGIAQNLLLIEPVPSCSRNLKSAPCVPETSSDPIPPSCGTLAFNTEVGLSSDPQNVTVRNDGPPGLDITIQLIQSGGTDYREHWQMIDTDGTVESDGIIDLGNLANNEERTIQVIFKPKITSAAGLPVGLKITSNSDACNTYTDVDTSNGSLIDIVVDLSGTAQKTPINFVMTLDRSGSMSQPVASTTRIALLKTAAKYFVDLLSARNNATDKVGLVRFDHEFGEISTFTGLQSVTSPVLTNLKTVIETSSDLSPRGATAIGGALGASDALFSTPAEKNAIVLFTDGEENVGPPWMRRSSPIVTYSNSPTVSTIGMGNLVTSSFQVALNQYAIDNNGSYYYVPDGTTYTSSTGDANNIPIDLKKAFLSIFSNIAGIQGVVDPLYYVSLSNAEKIVSSVMVTSSDRSAIFSVFDLPGNRKLYDVELRSPKGSTVVDGALPDGLIGRRIVGEDYFIFSVDFVQATDSSAFVGMWDLVLKPKQSLDGPDSTRLVVPIGFAASVFSDLQLNVDLGAVTDLPGNPLKVALEIKDGGLPLTKFESLMVVVKTPSGNQITLTPQKDLFGKWVAEYPHTNETGTYQVLVRSTQKNSKGEVSMREVVKNFAFGYPLPALTDDRCISCNWTRILIVIGVIVLIAILILVLIRKYAGTSVGSDR